MDEMHICSLIVQGMPSELTAICKRLRKLPGIDIFETTDSGKIIITLECYQSTDIIQTTQHITKLQGVLSCHLIFHQTEITN